MEKGLRAWQPPYDLPAPRDQCQASERDFHGIERRCRNTAKAGQRYCRRHRHWNLAREAWDSSKDAAIR